ncbi:GNAT family N-acetyltransferase [Allostreptomyces psammosilenae]|uniref:GNAT superfamily N-acetyltransferase n=1 Tax=Allostreptomyces psammosilenae TaxID=1892865 RepID=A0A853A477_9ACTN|nr:GNAT family N-acetyltransferase [Allostreptomyces psammosilenae]NYI08270.1 GNAT superfamily N-acetyltransferase [Allostreptomyces psammosilenae]
MSLPTTSPGPGGSGPAAQYELDDAPERVDRDAVWGFLSTAAYWGRWRTREDVEKQLDAAWRLVGAYRRGDGAMVGFARAISDGVGFAYLCDVFVLPEARGAGLGKELVRVMVEEGPGADFRWVLFTEDAHGLYERFGFAPPDATCLVRPSRQG